MFLGFWEAPRFQGAGFSGFGGLGCLGFRRLWGRGGGSSTAPVRPGATKGILFHSLKRNNFHTHIPNSNLYYCDPQKVNDLSQ